MGVQFILIWDQIGHLAAQNGEFDIVAFSVAVLDVLTLFPFAAVLRPIIKPAKRAIQFMNRGNPRATKYLGGVIKRMYDGVKDRNFDLIFQGIAFFIIIADSFSDPEALEGISAMVSTITSTEDFVTWIEYFGLADDEFKTGDVVMVDFASQEQIASSSMLSIFVSDANAGFITGTRALINQLFRRLKPIAKDPEDAKFIVRAIRVIVGVVKKKTTRPTDQAKVRKHMFNASMLRGVLSIAKRGSIKNLRNWLLGFDGQRVRPLSMIVIAAYIEEQIAEGELFSEEGKHPFDIARDRTQLNRLYVEAVPSFASGDSNGFALIKAFGASYHLMQLAYLHSTRSVTGDIVGIEVARQIRVLPTREAVNAEDGSRKKWPTSKPYLRKVDIVTRGNKGTEQWWEVKSWRSVSKQNRAPSIKVSPWPFNNDVERAKKTQIDDSGDEEQTAGLTHKQYSLDRIATKQGAFLTLAEEKAKSIPPRENTAGPNVLVSNHSWSFHSFTSGKSKNIVNPTSKALKGVLELDPKGGGQAYTRQAVKKSGIIKVGGSAQLFDSLKRKGVELAEDAANDAFEELKDE